jgi:hypothetical protein
MIMNRFGILMLSLMLAAGLTLGGCKKKADEAGTETGKAAGEAGAEAGKVLKSEPSEKSEPQERDLAGKAGAEAEKPAEVAPVAVEDVVEEAPAEKPAEGAADATEVPPAEAAEAVPAEAAPKEAAPAEAAPAEAAPKEEPADEEPAEAPAPEGDIVTGDAAAEEAPVNEKHFGREFKLDAIMMISDVTKYPDHYATFENIKLRGKVMGVQGNQVLLGHETTDGFFLVCTDLGDHAGQKYEVGTIIQLEGKLVEKDWALDGFGTVETGEKEKSAADGYVLSVEAGESE